MRHHTNAHCDQQDRQPLLENVLYDAVVIDSSSCGTGQEIFHMSLSLADVVCRVILLENDISVSDLCPDRRLPAVPLPDNDVKRSQTGDYRPVALLDAQAVIHPVISGR